MSDGFAGSTTGGFKAPSKSSLYAATALRLAAEHEASKSSGGGILGHIEGLGSHLVSDIVSSTEGMPAGIIHMATQSPVKSVKEIYAGEAATWSPLLHGDYHTFVHNFYEHPLGPILDVAGLVTGGAGLAAKAGILGEVGEGGLRTLQVGSKTEAVGRFSDNPVIRARQVAADSMSKNLDRLTQKFGKSTPFIGEAARGTRAMQRILDTRKAADGVLANSYAHVQFKLNKSWKKTAQMTLMDGNSPLERLAAQQGHIEKINTTIAKQHAAVLDKFNATERVLHEHLHIERASTADKLKHDKLTGKLQAQLDTLDSKAKQLEDSYQPMDPLNERALSDPRAENLYHDTQDALRHLRTMGYEAGKIPLRLQDVLDAPGAPRISRDVRHQIIARDAASRLAKRDQELRGVGETQAEHRRYLHQLLNSDAHMLPDKIVSYVKNGETKLGELHGKRVKAIDDIGTKKGYTKVTDYKKLDPLSAHEALEQFFPMDAPKVSRELWHEGGMDKLLKKVKAAHAKRDLAEPVYMPDKMMLQKDTKVRANQVQRTSTLTNHTNAGMLYMAGLLSHDPMLLGKQFMMDSMVAHTQDAAEEVIRHAESHYGSTVPDGYVAVKDMGVKRGYMNDSLPQFRAEMQKHLDDGNVGAAVRNFVDSHFSPSAGEASTVGRGTEKHMLIVHKKFLDAVVPEYHKSSAFANAIWHRPGRVWKHMVLAGRPLPFIINNVVGNSVMYGLRNNDLASLHGLISSHNEERAFEDTQPGSHLAFGHSVAIKRPGAIGKTINKPYEVTSAHEHLLRRATFLAAGKSMRVVKNAAKDLKDAGYNPLDNEGKTLFHAALDKAEKEHGGVHAEIAKRIEDTMGDYHHFSKTEQNIRSVMPFYSWTRHAMRAYYKVLTDKPLTAALMTHVGNLGSEQTNKVLGDVPAFMKSYVPLSILSHLPGMDVKGDTAVLDTRSLNPESTVADTINSVKALVNGDPSKAAESVTSNLSPLITAPFEQITGKSLLTGAPIPSTFGTRHGLIGGVAGNILTNLPPVKLVADMLPGKVPGSAYKDSSLEKNQFTPTGRPKKVNVPTTNKDWHTALLNTLFGIQAKDTNLPADQTWQKSIETKAGDTQYHVAKKRKSSAATFKGTFK